jgi:hypothetical protein
MTKFEARRKFCLALAPPLAVAIVIVAGLSWLCVENLNGSVSARQSVHDRAVAIRNLLFRD